MAKRPKANPAAVGQALISVIDARQGEIDASSLSRSLGVDLQEVIRVLKMKGRYNG